MACETEQVPVRYFVDAEFDDSSTPGRFGPIATCDKAENLVLVLAGREDVKKVTLIKEAVL